jgi:hypothetical protein
VPSLARPGGNMTGARVELGYEIWGKRLQILKEAVPSASQVVYLDIRSFWVEVAQAIQLSIAYAPEPPFSSGTPESAPPAILEQVRLSYRAVTEQREQTVRRVAERFGIGIGR